ncbi:lema family protein [Variovorax sp. J22G21]|uniref:lema family protein n=1 Tax=Variovorax fucosicus TaxID=3053517 RepID=UPI0025757487|nr:MULTISPECIES: lema family protein [unclassified Variovorax]MDM0039752.1 lema family protein [Variovorax sp. J22R193]MDM0064527.1 lema family protein [Variovorax sp. J22G21]
MHLLPDNWPLWVGAALVLFWFVGAHNRLMRLRSVALQAYATLDAALLRQLDFVQGQAAQAEPVADGAGDASAAASLRAATGQLTTMLAATRLHPLDPQAVAALGTALRVLLAAWQRLHPEAGLSFDADGTLSRPAPLGGRREAASHPSAEPIVWPEPSAAAEIARGQFNLAVAQYNTAVGQFPALLVAWAFRLRRAAPLL